MLTLEIPAKMISKRHSIILGIDDSKAINQRKLKELMFDSSWIKCRCLSWQTSYFIGHSPPRHYYGSWNLCLQTKEKGTYGTTYSRLVQMLILMKKKMKLLRLVTDYREDVENVRNWFLLGWVNTVQDETKLYKMVGVIVWFH